MARETLAGRITSAKTQAQLNAIDSARRQLTRIELDLMDGEIDPAKLAINIELLIDTLPAIGVYYVAWTDYNGSLVERYFASEELENV